jgi:hypothetical protein
MRAMACTVVAVCGLVSGCKTALVSNELNQGSQNGANGLVYRLPLKQFDITVTYELVSCTVDQTAGNAQLGTNVTGTVVETVVGDDERTYFLDYSKLSAPTKVSNIDIGVSDTGLLTAIGAPTA